MSDHIFVVLVTTVPVPTFTLRDALGSRPRVGSVAVVDVATEQVVWWVLPAAFTASHRFALHEPDEEEIQQLAASAEIDPIEDLPPGHPRHQEAVRTMERVAEQSVAPLPTLTYGVVPEGFRQVTPDQGPAPHLVPGRTYGLQVARGDAAGYLTFEATR